MVVVPAEGGVAASPQLREFDALVWQPGKGVTAGTSCTAASARAAFGPRFVNYLARFLLAYDTGARRLWRARSEEIPLGWSQARIEEGRTAQLGEFVNAVETGLCDFVPESGDLSNATDGGYAKAGVRRLLSLLRSRYGDRPDALRQIALLFSLLDPGAQPSRAIDQLIAEVENRMASQIVVLDGGSIVLSTKNDAAGLPRPSVPRPAAPIPPTARAADLAAVARAPRLEPTGRIVGLVLDRGACGYSDDAPPAVSITAPLGGRELLASSKGRPPRTALRAATAQALVRNGSIVALDLVDSGAGYSVNDRVVVAIAPPADASRCGTVAEASALLEYEVVSVALKQKGRGYGSAQDLAVTWDADALNGDDGTFIIRSPRATLVLGDRVGGGGAPPRGALWNKNNDNNNNDNAGDLYERPPRPPATPNVDRSTIAGFLSLLPPDQGGPIWDPGSTDRNVPPQHRFPSALFEVAERPLRTPLGTTVVVTGLRALPTSVSGGVRQDVPLTPNLVARLALAGGLCSAITRAATNPLDLRKTRRQAAASSLRQKKQQHPPPGPLPPPPPLTARTPGTPPSPSSSSADDADDHHRHHHHHCSSSASMTPAGTSHDDYTTTAHAPLNETMTTKQESGDVAVTSTCEERTLATAAAFAKETAAPNFGDGAPAPNNKGPLQPQQPQRPLAAEEEPPFLARLSAVALSPLKTRKWKKADDGVVNDWLGLDASFFAGLALGSGSFGTYEALRRSLPLVLEAVTHNPAAPVAYETQILLVASTLSTVFSTIVAAPFESARAKVMAGQEGAPTTLLGALEALAKDGHHQTADWRRLWDGLPALLGRELPFGITKLLVFVKMQAVLLGAIPAARERPLFGVLVAIVSGLVAGVAGALASQPADTVVTRLAAKKDLDSWRDALQDITADAETSLDAVRCLYAGLAQRCASLAVLVCLQFILFDSLRTLLAVSPKDLSLVLDVFSDRLSYYEGWDELSQSWVDALDVLDDDSDLI